MNIILYGFKNSGKTTVAVGIAKKLGVKLIDLDRLVEKLYFLKTNKKLNIRDIYEEVEEKKFRKLEKQAISSLKKEDNLIIATGGGSVLDDENVRRLKKNGKLVYLACSKEIIKERMFSLGIPAFIDKKNPQASFESMYTNRIKKYESIADFLIDTENKSINRLENEIIGIFYGKQFFWRCFSYYDFWRISWHSSWGYCRWLPFWFVD